MNTFKTIITACSFTLLCTTQSHAHFGMIIPSTNTIGQDNREVELTLSFSHPFEGVGMELEKPNRFYVFHDGNTQDLLPALKESSVMGKKAWSGRQKIKRPGVYQYVMEPVPYWEPAEDLYITHYTKTIVAAFGAEEGWDQPVGLPTEIIPLLRPFGNYAGNIFTGKVLLHGKPAAHCEVEVEFYDKQKNFTPPSDYHITQVIKTDSNGVFSFSCPVDGWWGFSALNEDNHTKTGPDSKEKSIEIGAVLWMYFDAFNGPQK